VQFGEPAHDGQAQAGAAGFGGEERIEQPGALFFVQWRGAIADLDADLIALAQAAVQADAGFRRRRLDGIDQQVQQHLSETVAVSAQGEIRRRFVAFDPDAPLPQPILL